MAFYFLIGRSGVLCSIHIHSGQTISGLDEIVGITVNRFCIGTDYLLDFEVKLQLSINFKQQTFSLCFIVGHGRIP